MSHTGAMGSHDLTLDKVNEIGRSERKLDKVIEIGRSEQKLDKVKEFENIGQTHWLLKAKSIRKHAEKCENMRN